MKTILIYKINSGFTLIELIVSIVILTILSSIAFISLKDYPKNARDSIRKTDISNLKFALNIYNVKKSTFPQPDEFITESGKTISVIGEGVIKELGIFGDIPLDPITKIPYKYQKIGKNSYILESNLEGPENKFVQIIGDKLKNCSEILISEPSSGDGKYFIIPKNIPIEVECDMTSEFNGKVGGWTKYLDIKSEYTGEQALKCWKGDIITSSTLDCFNPIKQNLGAKEFLAKQTLSGYENKYFLEGTSENLTANHRSSLRIYKCLGGEDYMTVTRVNHYPSENANIGITRIWLGLNLCKYNWSLGGYNYEVGNQYMNFSPVTAFGPPTPSNRDWRDTVNPVKIYIR